LDQQARDPDHREHMFNYIWDNPNYFRIGTCDPLDNALAHPDLRLDLDTPDDYAWLLSLPVLPDMSAQQIVSAALLCPRNKVRQ
jgi:spore coat polysaccharide biosynthesis protein SpsF